MAERIEHAGEAIYMVDDGDGGFRPATEVEAEDLARPLDEQVLAYRPPRTAASTGVAATRGGMFNGKRYLNIH